MKTQKIQLEIEVTKEMINAFQLNFDMTAMFPDLKPLEALKIILQYEIQKDIDETVGFYRRMAKGKKTGNHYLVK